MCSKSHSAAFTCTAQTGALGSGQMSSAVEKTRLSSGKLHPHVENWKHYSGLARGPLLY